jgi:hypothetical protein
MWRRRKIFGAARFVIIAAFLIAFFAITGHFFWPIIPILIFLNVIRFSRLRRGGWGGPGWGGGRGWGGPGSGGPGSGGDSSRGGWRGDQPGPHA